MIYSLYSSRRRRRRPPRPRRRYRQRRSKSFYFLFYLFLDSNTSRSIVSLHSPLLCCHHISTYIYNLLLPRSTH